MTQNVKECVLLDQKKKSEVIMVGNAILFSFIFYKLCKYGHTMSVDHAAGHSLPVWTSRCALWTNLQGVTWIIGVFHSDCNSDVLDYAFTILASSQGFIFFVLYFALSRTSYYARSGRVAVIASSEGVTSIPEHSWLGPGWNQRARGTDRYRDEDIQLHEYVHGVHLLGAKYAIPGWQRRLESLYRSARYSGKWANTYSMSTQDEYFAKLRAYDPALYQLVLDVFPCNNQYLKRCSSDCAV
nr:hypothetical protein BaRGS_000708 [Batillaria attramentaria]